MNSVAPSRARERLERRARVGRGSAKRAARAARARGTGGRGRSVGSSSAAGAPASCCLPVGELPRRAPRRASQRALPDGEVGVLDRAARAAATAGPSRERRVEGAELAQRTPVRPAVGDDVVHASAAARGRSSARRRRRARRSGPAARSKGARASAATAARGLALGVGAPASRPTGSAHVRAPSWMTWHRAAVRRRRRWCAAPRGGARSRRARARARPRRARPESRRARGTLYDALARVELVEEPEPLLRERERSGRPRGARTIGGAVGAAPGASAALDARPRAPPRVGASKSARSGSSTPSSARIRAIDLRRQQRVPAELEEVVVHADPRGRRLQHLGQDAGERLLDRAARRHVRRAPRARPPRAPGAPRAIDLAVRRQRQRRRASRTPPAPCTRAAAPRGRAQLRRRRAPPAPSGDDVGHEPPVARRVLAHHHRASRTPGCCRQRRLDLAQLDAEAADLDLVVGAAEELELAVARASAPRSPVRYSRPRRAARTGRRRSARPSAPAGSGSRAPRPRRRRTARRPRRRAPAVGARRARSTPQVWRSGTPIGLAPGLAGSAPSHRPVGDVHRRLGDPVHVDQLRPPSPCRSNQGRSVRHVQRLAAEDHLAQRRLRRRVRRLRPRRRAAGTREGVWFRTVTRSRAQQRVERAGRRGSPVRHDHQPARRAAARPTAPTRRSRRRIRVEQRPHVARGRSRYHALRRREEAHHVAVVDQHPLGLAGRARGVDHVGEARGEASGRRGRRAARPRCSPSRRRGARPPRRARAAPRRAPSASRTTAAGASASTNARRSARVARDRAAGTRRPP